MLLPMFPSYVEAQPNCPPGYSSTTLLCIHRQSNRHPASYLPITGRHSSPPTTNQIVTLLAIYQSQAAAVGLHQSIITQLAIYQSQAAAIVPRTWQRKRPPGRAPVLAGIVDWPDLVPGPASHPAGAYTRPLLSSR
jgi:hypothetical protein